MRSRRRSIARWACRGGAPQPAAPRAPPPAAAASAVPGVRPVPGAGPRSPTPPEPVGPRVTHRRLLAIVALVALGAAVGIALLWPGRVGIGHGFHRQQGG